MEPTRGLTVHFTDGTKVSYSFPQQEKDVAARKVRLEQALKNPFLMVVADGVLTAFPMANIKAIQVPFDEASEGAALPPTVVRGATLTRGDL
jgi:hypothetical protein